MPTDDPTTEAAQVRTDALAQARKVSATLLEHAAETERLGRPAPATVTALQQSGLLALSVPRQFGGQEAGLGTQARVALELGRGCPSVGWVASLSGAAKGMIAPMLTPATRTTFFDDPHALVCASGVGNGRAVRQNGDLRVSGRWRMASGCEVATWASLLVTVHDENDQVAEAGLILVRVEELEIDRGWRSAGLQGTGSYGLVADNLLIPGTFSAVGPVAGPPAAPPARVSLGAVVAHLAPLVGATSGQLEASRALFSGDRVPSRTTYAQLVDSPLARDWFARAERAVGAAVRDTLAVADALDHLSPGEEPSADLRSTWRMDLVSAAASCRSALEHLLDLSGAAGFDPQEPLQRVWRDVAVGTRYAGLNPYVAVEDHARVLLGAGAPVSLL